MGVRQKHQKPLALDARCLLRAIDAVPARKSSSKLGYFQSATSSPLLGSCIHRKAINKDKHLSSGNFCSTTDWTDWTDLLVEEIDQKVSVGLGGVPPWAFRHRLCSRRVLAAPYGATPSPALQDLPNPQKTKQLPLAVQKGSHGATTISFAWCEGLPSSGFLFYHGLDVFSIRIR